MPRPVALGLVGVGRWGRNYIHAIADSGEARLAAVATRNPEVPMLVGPDCRVVAEWRALIADPRIEAVVIATPPAAHAAIAQVALDSGKAVLVEKPLTLDVAEAEALAGQSRRAGITLMVDFIHLFNPGWSWLKGQLNDIGRMRHIRSEGGNLGPYRLDTSPLWDWAPHDFAMVLDLAGQAPQNLRARRLTSRRGTEGYSETIEFEFGFGKDLCAHVVCGNNMPRKRRIAVTGTRGEIIYDDIAKAGHISVGGEERTLSLPGGGLSPLATAVRTFAHAVRGDAVATPDTLALAVTTTRLLAAANRALAAQATTVWTKVL